MAHRIVDRLEAIEVKIEQCKAGAAPDRRYNGITVDNGIPMSKTYSKADEVVRVIRGELDGPGGASREPEDRAEFAALLERLRREARERLTDLTAANPASKMAASERVAIYFYACGLAAMGRADALLDVFE